MLTTIITSLAPLLIGKLADAFTAYQNKQITLAELNARVTQALIDGFAEVQKAQSTALEHTFASFMDAAKNSKLMRGVWATVTLSQLAVLLWHQVGISAFVRIFGGEWPSSGSTVEWAYVLVAACVGFGPVVLNRGPGKIDLGGLKAPGTK
jgi:hypothetical protein